MYTLLQTHSSTVQKNFKTSSVVHETSFGFTQLNFNVIKGSAEGGLLCHAQYRYNFPTPLGSVFFIIFFSPEKNPFALTLGESKKVNYCTLAEVNVTIFVRKKKSIATILVSWGTKWAFLSFPSTFAKKSQTFRTTHQITRHI